MRPKGGKQYYQKVQKTTHFVHLYITFKKFLLSYNKSSGLDLEPDLLVT